MKKLQLNSGLLLSIMVLFSSHVLAREVHVSALGSAKGSGSIDKPLATLEQARNKVRHIKNKNKNKNKKNDEPITVVIHQGHYPISQSVEFWKNDSGSEDNVITYQNAKGDSPVFFGGSLLNISDFKWLADGDFKTRLIDKTAAQHIRVIDLTAQGITDYGEITRHGWNINTPNRVAPVSLQMAGKRMTLARWPNVDEDSEYMSSQHYLKSPRPLRGYEKKVQAIIDNTKLIGEVSYLSVINEGDSASTKPQGKGGTFSVAFDRMKHWSNINNIFVDGVFSSTWEWSYNQLASVDIDKKHISLLMPELNGIGVGESVRLPHFHFDNVPEELDSPGEYYIDRDKGLLYLYPFKGSDSKDIVLTTLAEPMIKIENAKNITFKGLTFMSGRHLGIKIKNGENIVIQSSTVANFTLGGIDIYGKKNQVINSHIYGMGAFGIHLDGGNKKTLMPAKNVILNCHIHDFGWDQKSQQPGVMLDGVGQYLMQSKIHDGSHFAVRVRNANDIVIEKNEIFDLPKYHHFDGGALYVFSVNNPQNRGIEIRQNYFHDIPTIGVYPDNFTAGVHTYNNIFNRVGLKANRAAVFVNGGSDNKTYNNIFIDTVQSYGQGVRAKDPRWMKFWNKTKTRFGHGKVNKTAYAKYPDFITWLNKKEPEALYRGSSYVYNNVVYNPTVELTEQAKPLGIIDKSKNLVTSGNWLTKQEPGFVDFNKGNLNLKKDSIIYQKIPGFTPINFNKIGLDNW